MQESLFPTDLISNNSSVRPHDDFNLEPLLSEENLSVASARLPASLALVPDNPRTKTELTKCPKATIQSIYVVIIKPRCFTRTILLQVDEESLLRTDRLLSVKGISGSHPPFYRTEPSIR
jgi:hypothetical protein